MRDILSPRKDIHYEVSLRISGTSLFKFPGLRRFSHALMRELSLAYSHLWSISFNFVLWLLGDCRETALILYDFICLQSVCVYGCDSSFMIEFCFSFCMVLSKENFRLSCLHPLLTFSDVFLSSALMGDELGREIAVIALPAIVALAADPLASLVDTAFIGQIGIALTKFAEGKKNVSGLC